MSVLTIAGVRPIDIGLRVLRGSERPILPPTRDRTLPIPGRNGAWDFGADVEPRPFRLECAFTTQNAKELQLRAESLARILVDSYGKPKTIDMVFEVHPDRTYRVRYIGSLGIDRIVGLGRFWLPLIAFEPYAYGPEKIVEQTVTGSPESIAVESEGDIATPPTIQLTNVGGTTIREFTITHTTEIE